MKRGSASRCDLGLNVLVVSTPVVVAGLVLWLIADVVVRGMGAFRPESGLSLVELWRNVVEFLTAAPQRAGRAGGIGPILVSTILILAVCIAVALPFGLGTALWLSEVTPAGSGVARAVRRSLDVLAGVPSIVFGLFGNALFCRFLGLRFSILSGGLTLSCMVLPLLIRASEEGLRSVPLAQRQAAAALGLSKWAMLLRIVLPQAAPAVAVGLVLGIGRALAETAALIFTSGYVDRLPRSLLDSGRALSVHIYDLSMNVPGGNANAAASALVLILLLVALNAAARWLTARLLLRGERTA